MGRLFVAQPLLAVLLGFSCSYGDGLPRPSANETNHDSPIPAQSV